jgi:predicted dehydrogenase
VWEHRVWEKNGPEKMAFGVILHGEKGTLLFDNKGWHVRDGDNAAEPNGPDMVEAHQKNFIDAVRGNAAPNADIEEGHKSTRLCHLGNIAFRTGKALKFDAKTETTDDAGANKLLGRDYRRGFELPKV